MGLDGLTRRRRLAQMLVALFEGSWVQGFGWGLGFGVEAVEGLGFGVEGLGFGVAVNNKA